MIPYIDKNKQCLIVNGQPYFIFGGEVHNSSCSTISYFQEYVISQITDIPVNTLLLPIYWEMIEKEEGQYDMSLVKDIIDIMRANNLKIVFLWFGLWKNGLSTYIPAWMKINRKKYAFCQNEHGESLYTVSPLCFEAIEKDCQAYAELMKFIQSYDKSENTVIMMQVENEVGLLQSDRDYSSLATKYFNEMIPHDLKDYTHFEGTWQDVFKQDAPEIFMTYYYAKAIEKITKIGKEIYPIPTITNVWLNKENEKPGQYPSGGAIFKNLQLYQYLTPSLDLIAPDIYVKTIDEVSQQYASQGLLMIPETRQDKTYMSNIIYTIAKYPLIGYSPFGIEDFHENQETTRLYHFLSSLGIERDAFDPSGSLPYLQNIYYDLSKLWPLIFKYRQQNKIYPFIRKNMMKNDCLSISNYNIMVTYLNQEKNINGAGMIIDLDDEWLIYGVNCFMQVSNSVSQLGILHLEEKKYVDGKWETKRILNGDERYGIYILDQPKLLKVKFHKY